MRRTLAIPLILALLIGVGPATSEEVLVDGIAAQVGPDIVLISEVMQLAAGQERAMRAQGATQSDIALVRSDALEAVIESRLIERVVRDAELQATDAEIDATIEAIAQENQLSIREMQRSVASQQMEWAEYRKQIQRELERRKVVNAILGSKVTVDDDEIKALYHEQHAAQPESGSEVHLRQILVPGNEEGGVSIAEACKLTHRARDRIAGGEPFEDVAARYSVIALQNGGDLGWVHLDSIAGWMVEMIEPLEPGQLSAVHQLPVACTFVQLVERKEWNPVTLEEVRASLQQQIYEQKLMEEYRTWMEQLRKRTFIERRGYFAEAAGFQKRAKKSDFEEGLSGHSVLRGAAGAEAQQ